jgi:hypothetical protein
MWLSLVERCVRDAEVASSNLVIPIFKLFYSNDLRKRFLVRYPPGHLGPLSGPLFCSFLCKITTLWDAQNRFPRPLNPKRGSSLTPSPKSLLRASQEAVRRLADITLESDSAISVNWHIVCRLRKGRRLPIVLSRPLPMIFTIART